MLDSIEHIIIGIVAVLLCIMDFNLKKRYRELRSEDLNLTRSDFLTRRLRKINFMEVTEAICFSAIPYAYGIIALTYYRAWKQSSLDEFTILQANFLICIILTIMPLTYSFCLRMHKTIDKAKLMNKNSLIKKMFVLITLPNALLNWFILFNVGILLFETMAKNG